MMTSTKPELAYHNNPPPTCGGVITSDYQLDLRMVLFMAKANSKCLRCFQTVGWAAGRASSL